MRIGFHVGVARWKREKLSHVGRDDDTPKSASEVPFGSGIASRKCRHAPCSHSPCGYPWPGFGLSRRLREFRAERAGRFPNANPRPHGEAAVTNPTDQTISSKETSHVTDETKTAERAQAMAVAAPKRAAKPATARSRAAAAKPAAKAPAKK